MDNMELLFFDTFSHDISEEINLDLVQFPKPVYISEVRIIPLGARVQADFPGGVRLGATNPSQFEIEFFVNDLSKPGASTFESLGGLEYKQNVHIQLECERKHLPTDGLVLRGWYTTITLAIYGTLTKSLNNPPEIISGPPPAPITVQQEELNVSNEKTPEQEKDWYHENRSHANAVLEICPTATPSPPIHIIPVTEPVKPSVESPKHEQQWKKDESPIGQKSVKKPSTPPPESLVSLSPESISAEEEEGEPEEEENAIAEPFEPILSDEDIMADEAPASLDYECDIQVNELYSNNPPDLLDIEKHDAMFCEKLNDIATEKLRDSITSLSKSVYNFNNLSGQEKETFVHNCENLCSLIQDFNVSAQDFENLSQIVDAGLNFDFACSQPQPAYKVRHVKVGVRFAEALCRLRKTGPEILLKTNAPFKLLSLCMRENFALPVKLAAIRAVDSALVDPQIVLNFLETENELYKLCLMMLDTAKLARLKYALSSLLRKIHVFESLSELKELTELEVQELMNAYSYSSTLMAQPKRQLPASAQMEFDREISRNPCKHLIAYFKHWKLASRLLIVLCSPDSDCTLIQVCRKFISLISDSKEGLLYLLEESQVTKSLLKVLKYDEPGIGLSLAWKLQVIQRLLEIVKDPNDWSALRKLHSYLIYPEGLQATINVISMDYFIDIIISCLSNKDQCEFASVLIAFVIRYSDKVQIFQHRSSDLLEKSRNHSVLREVIPHLNVLSTSTNWNYGNVDALVGIIKKNAENAPSFPGELVSACRMLHYLVFPSNDDVDPMEPYIELKYKNALTQVFAADGLTAILSVMTNVFQFYELPLLHYNCLIGQRRLALISLLSPCIKLTKVIVERLVKCMGTGFKNLTAVVPLLGVYCILEAIPTTNATLFLTNEIIEALLLYTQAVDSDGSGNVAKSLWTQMLGEVLKMITSNPCNFVPGLKLLSRLLPPILTSRETFSVDKTRAIGFRKLWSAHLQAQATSLTDTLRLLCASWNTEVLTLVSTVCKQLSDLAAPTALLVGRCLLDGILTASPLESNLPILALLCDLMKHPPMKATILTLTSPASRAQVKSDQKYPPVIEMMCVALKNSSDFKIQREIIDIFETLCDHELGLIQGGMDSFEKQLSHSVPSKEPLLFIIGALIEILANPLKFSNDIIETILKILVILTTHNYGFYHVKSSLENKPDALKSFLDYVVSDLEKNQILIKKIIIFLDNLTSCKGLERTLYLRMSQLSLLISWEKSSHPLEKIPQAAEIVQNLQISEEKEEKDPIPEMLEPLLQTPEALLNQFAQRSISSLDVAKNSDFKRLLLNVYNESTVDLLALAAESLPSDFNLLTETQRICSKIPLHYTTHFQVQNANHDNNRQPQKQITTPIVKIKQPFVSPMRGRNQFSNPMRGASSGGGVGRGADPFRSRPPNTSRPPSLHVDDFVALETCGAQPTGPTGYNKLSIRGTNPPRGVLSGSRSRPWVPEGRPYLR